MLPLSLLRENVARADGFGPPVDVSRASGKLLVLTLGITRIIEQESLEVSIWSSPDGLDWGAKPLSSFPQKFYCGLYSTLLNLSNHPEARYLRIGWKMSRWRRPVGSPMFAFYVDAEESGSRVRTATATASPGLHVAVA